MSDRRHVVGRQSCDADFTDWYTVDAKIENGILVLEDINEHPFRVERMLLQLYHAEFCHVRRRLFSVALAAARPMIMTQVTTESVYAFLRSRLSIPLITGLDFGHEQRTVTLPLGAHAILNNTRKALS